MESDQPRGEGISSLPVELIFRIITFINPFTDPTSLVNFACTAKFLANRSHPILARHKAAHDKFRVISDLDPSIVPGLVRSALGYSDPIDAWYVRSFEVWGTRRSWDEWRPFNLEEEGPYTVQGGEPFTWHFENGEDRQLIDTFRDQMSEEEQRLAHEELQRGGDGFLKMALLCHLPRLVDIKTIRGVHDVSSCVGWLVRAVAWFSQSASWPPGLAGLRDVAIGISSGTWRDESTDTCSPHTLGGMLQFPQLRSLYLNDLYVEEVDADGEYVDLDEDILPPASTVSRLFLDNVNGMSSEFQTELVETPRALEAFSVRALHPIEHVDEMVNCLSKAQGGSLQQMMFYNPDKLDGYRCSAYLPEELADCRALRHVTMGVWDIELFGMYESQHESAEAFSEYFVEAFPRTLEVFVFFGNDSGFSEGFLEGQKFDLEYFDSAIVKMIDSGLYPNLKAIFFEDVDIPETEGSPARVSLQQAMDAGKRKNVEIYKYTKTPKKRVDQVDFHAPLGKYDLVSGPHWRKDRDGLVLNPFNGEWEAR